MLGGGPSQWPCSGGAGRSEEEEEEEEEGERWSVVLLSGALRTVSMCVCVCVHACVCLCKYVYMYMCEKKKKCQVQQCCILYTLLHTSLNNIIYTRSPCY